MALSGSQHKHRVSDQLPAVADHPAAVACAQRVAEIPKRPGKFVESLFDLEHPAKIGLAHRLEAWGRSEYRAHQRSLVLSATLSRRYTGTASAASFASPAAKRGVASFSTARAVGAVSGRIAETLSPSRAPSRSRCAAEPSPPTSPAPPGARGTASGLYSPGTETSSHPAPSLRYAA